MDSVVELCGWVQYVRDFGKVVFFVIKDRTGIIQCYTSTQSEELLELVKKLSIDDVVRVRGTVKRRSRRSDNPNMENGDIEIEVEDFEVLNPCAPLPYDVNGEPSEFTKLKYRYVDIRHGELLTNLKTRSVASSVIRNYLARKGFWEIETPY